MLQVEDNSDVAAITFFEEKLLIKHVELWNFENRIKKFVYNRTEIKLKQLQAAFAGDADLEEMLNNQDSLDYKLLFDKTIPNFIIPQDSDHLSDDEDIGENHVHFDVQALLLFGILYCKAEPSQRVEKFYELCQHGMDQTISASDT
jgi:hypothetical protein